MSEIVLSSQEELEKKFAEAVLIMRKENEFLDKWMTHFGSTNRGNLERWRIRAKQFLKELNIQEDDGGGEKQHTGS